MHAIEYRKPKMFSLLIERDDIDLEIVDCNRSTAVQLAGLYSSRYRYIQPLIRRGARVDNWYNWGLWRDNEFGCINPTKYLGIMSKWRSYLPTWSLKTQRIYPAEFQTLALKILCVFQRIKQKTDHTVAPDMRKVLVSYAATFWQQIVDEIKLS
jgi:hypothetical protein